MPVSLIDPDARLTIRDADLPNVQGGDKDTVYTYRQIDTATHLALIKEHTEDKGYDRQAHQRRKELNGEALSDALIDYVLTDWSGVTFKGEPVKCEKPYKVRLDAIRRASLLELAGLNQVNTPAEVAAGSFRGSESPRDLVGRSAE
jgi:hypothetical protein